MSREKSAVETVREDDLDQGHHQRGNILNWRRQRGLRTLDEGSEQSYFWERTNCIWTMLEGTPPAVCWHRCVASRCLTPISPSCNTLTTGSKAYRPACWRRPYYTNLMKRIVVASVDRPPQFWPGWALINWLRISETPERTFDVSKVLKTAYS